MTTETDRPVLEIEVTPEMIRAGVAYVKSFYPAEWGGKAGIRDGEALLLVKGLLANLLERPPERR